MSDACEVGELNQSLHIANFATAPTLKGYHNDERMGNDGRMGHVASLDMVGIAFCACRSRDRGADQVPDEIIGSVIAMGLLPFRRVKCAINQTTSHDAPTEPNSPIPPVGIIRDLQPMIATNRSILIN